MPRFQRGMSLRPINSVKNILDATSIGVAAAVNTGITLAQTVNDYTGGVVDVPIGAKVSSVYIFVQIIAQAAEGVMDFYIAKRPAGVILPTPGTTGGNQARKFILHEEKGIPGTFNNGASPLTFRGVIKIPRGRQRFAEGDDLTIQLRGSVAYSLCIKCIYKFYQ